MEKYTINIEIKMHRSDFHSDGSEFFTADFYDDKDINWALIVKKMQITLLEKVVGDMQRESDILSAIKGLK